MKYFIMVALWFLFSSTYSQLKPNNKISNKKLEFMITKYMDTVQFASPSVVNGLKIVKIQNTIIFNNLDSIKIYYNFRKIYYDFYHYKMIDLLQAKRWKGGAYYSKKFDIFIGGPNDLKSRYVIDSICH